jgi:hypothetical protein
MVSQHLSNQKVHFKPKSTFQKGPPKERLVER